MCCCSQSQVTFQLHPSFKDPVRRVEQPPYELTETGWGEFDISIVVSNHNTAEGVQWSGICCFLYGWCRSSAVFWHLVFSVRVVHGAWPWLSPAFAAAAVRYVVVHYSCAMISAAAKFQPPYVDIGCDVSRLSMMLSCYWLQMVLMVLCCCLPCYGAL